MRRLPALPLAASLLLSQAAFAAVRPHHHSSTHALVRRTASAHASRAGHLTEHSSSNASISPERATEIQSALIQRGYLAGEPSGTWDAASVAAMQKLQSDSGWQTKYVPDSRALIKLGLGAGSPSATAPAANVSSTTPAVPGSFSEQTF